MFLEWNPWLLLQRVSGVCMYVWERERERKREKEREREMCETESKVLWQSWVYGSSCRPTLQSECDPQTVPEEHVLSSGAQHEGDLSSLKGNFFNRLIDKNIRYKWRISGTVISQSTWYNQNLSNLVFRCVHLSSINVTFCLSFVFACLHFSSLRFNMKKIIYLYTHYSAFMS